MRKFAFFDFCDIFFKYEENANNPQSNSPRSEAEIVHDHDDGLSLPEESGRRVFVGP